MSQNLPEPVEMQNNTLPLNSLVAGNTINDVLMWNGTAWVSSPSSGGAGTILGTANQITANTVSTTTTLSLPSALIAPGSLTTTGSLTSGTNLTVNGSTNLGIKQTLSSNNNLSVASVFYNTGTASQLANTITGVGTTFTSAMVGMNLTFANDVSAGFILAVNSTTSLTVSTNQSIISQSYTIYNYSVTNNSLTGNVGIDTIAPPNNFSVMPVNTGLTFPGTVSQSSNTVTGVGTNFTSSMLSMRLTYTTGVDGGLITAVDSTTSLTVSTSQSISSTNYLISYPGFQVSSTGQSILSGKAFTTETINTSTALSPYLDSYIDTTNAALTCTLAAGIADQYKTVRLNTLRSNTATVSCVLGGGGTFQLTPSDPVRNLRYNATSGYWQIEGGISVTVPTPTSFYPTTQQGTKLVGTGITGSAQQGIFYALSADGNTLAVGGNLDNSFQGATWIFTRSAGVWSQQGTKLVGTGATGTAVQQGVSCALSADGNTLAVGGYGDNSFQGATWIFTRAGATWSQQGTKLVGTGDTGSARQGWSCALSADGNTLATGGYSDDSNVGATWIFTRSGATWSQQGAKLVGTGVTGSATQGISCALSANGNTLAVGGYSDDSSIGATWIFTRSGATWSQQGDKLVGTGDDIDTPYQGQACALSADGNTLAVGGYLDDSGQGATWIFTRSGTTWSQQGDKLVGTDHTGAARQGYSCALSADGNTLAVGGYADDSDQGAIWIFTRSGAAWSQRGAKLVGTGVTDDAAWQGWSCALSADGNTLATGGFRDNSYTGATWIFT
jgi:hypothetical protein